MPMKSSNGKPVSTRSSGMRGNAEGGVTRTFAHISDIHLNAYRLTRADMRSVIESACGGPVDPHLFGVMGVEATLRLLRYVRDELSGTDFLLMTGDLFGVPGAGVPYDRVLDLLHQIADQGTRIVFCTGTHDHRNGSKSVASKAAYGRLRSLCSAIFQDEMRFEQVDVDGVRIYGIGNRHHSDRYGDAKANLIQRYRPTGMEMFLAHCPSALAGISGRLLKTRGYSLEHAYLGAGHKHDYRPEQVKPCVPGSVPLFVLSQFMKPARGKLTSQISRCGFRVTGAGLIEGEIDAARAPRLWFHEARCEPVMDLGIARTLSFRRKPISISLS